MRLHELSIAAFGPFVDTVHVDFDELAAGGLFLLTGDTGSGKTSVLDAVCFALYGEVPGDRHTARHLRSDQADPHAEPRVVLSLTIGDRTFRFTRSPAWDRPKKRTAGTTRVQAHVVIEERRAEGWVGLTNRLDEAGQLVTALLGMTCTQFTQVAMLPQGRFQAFLRATSSERQAVLQRLFRTRRYEDVERWLVERRVELRRRSQACGDRSAGVLSRIQEAAGVDVPEQWELQDLDPVVADGSLLEWAETVERDVARAATTRRLVLDTATSTLETERAALEAAGRLAEARDRGERAQQVLTALADTFRAEQELRASLEAHRRAAPLLPLTLRVEEAATAAVAADREAGLHLTAAADLLGVPPAELRAAELVTATTRASELRAVAESWLPREHELHDACTRVNTLTGQLSHLGDEIDTGEQRDTELSGARSRVASALASAEAVAARADGDRAALVAASAGLESARQTELLTAELRAARALLEDSTLRAQDLREVYLDLKDQRISGMAAELATGLVVGCGCPVCGSEEHPAPAVATSVVNKADEDAAYRAHETAAFERQAVAESVKTLEAQLVGAVQGSHGRAVDDWLAEQSSAEAALATSTAAGQEAAQLGADLQELEQQAGRLKTRLATLRTSRDERTHQQQEACRRKDALAAELDQLLATHEEATTVAALVDRHATTVRILDEARERLTARERAAHELELATAAAHRAARGAGFDSPEQAAAAVLDGGQEAARSAELDARSATRGAAEAVLSEAAVAEALDAPIPDLAVLRTSLRAAQDACHQAHAAQQQAARRVERLATLTTELRDGLAAWEPVRLEHALTAGLASLVEGKSVDNQLRMRLSAYVLSERLRQVVAAANERLGQMTDERYTLEQVDDKGAGEQRGGLSLRVRDEWSGKDRDPATLSGGETFLVSLALALGLADTVTHEAGGTQLDTLFIDEGFGALDATTLDGVMDTLDSLRDGGRVVGLVSHVAELRNRVTAQLEVRKARLGSTVTATLASG